jgi:mannose/fructose/N-acetylgalactosamine-specific phosphotransferase system component IIC
MTAAVPVLLGAFAIIGAVFAAIWLFIASQRADSAESAADRAARWREQMRKLSHDRRYQ